MKQPRSTSMNRGADDERAAILRYVRSLIRKNKIANNRDAFYGISDVELYIKGRAKRNAKRKGGLGR